VGTKKINYTKIKVLERKDENVDDKKKEKVN